MTYLDHTRALYDEAARTPDAALCCTSAPPWRLPGLSVPRGMLERNYGCGSTTHPRELADIRRVLYVGVGAGLEALQAAYFVRHPGGVLGIDVSSEMLEVADELLAEARTLNSWLTEDAVELRRGDALDLPVEAASVDVAAQNCLFNIFVRDDLDRALREMHRVLRPGGALLLSDPICDRAMPARLRDDPELRARCLSGAIPLDEYVAALVDAGFGTIEVRSRRPYRVLDRRRFEVDEDLLLESVEVIARRDRVPADGPCVFTGRAAIYVGDDPAFDDGKGHSLSRDVPLGVCDKTAAALAALGRDDLVLTPPTWHYAGDGCC